MDTHRRQYAERKGTVPWPRLMDVIVLLGKQPMLQELVAGQGVHFKVDSTKERKSYVNMKTELKTLI